jgi:hypothetical protein
MHLVEAHPNLTHLRLSEASALTDAGVAAALRKLKGLSLVSISVEEGFLSEGAIAGVGEDVTIELMTEQNFIIRAPGKEEVVIA